MKTRKIVATLILILLLVSCTSIRVDFGDGSSFKILGFGAQYKYVDEYQLISGSFPYLGEDMAFEAYTIVDKTGIHLVAFLPTGQTFAKIDWDGFSLSYDSSFMPQGKYFAQYIISDLQLCYATYENLCDNFDDSGLTLTETTVLSKTTRVLKNGKNVIEKVVIEPGLITVENTAANYKYEIETL